MKPPRNPRKNWTEEDERLLLTFSNETPQELQRTFFPECTVAAVAHRLRKSLEAEKFNDTSPWTSKEIDFVASHLKLSNQDIQKTVRRHTFDISRVKYYLKNNLPLPIHYDQNRAQLKKSEKTSKTPAKSNIKDPVLLKEQVDKMKSDKLRQIGLEEILKIELLYKKVNKLLEADAII